MSMSKTTGLWAVWMDGDVFCGRFTSKQSLENELTRLLRVFPGCSLQVSVLR